MWVETEYRHGFIRCWRPSCISAILLIALAACNGPTSTEPEPSAELLVKLPIPVCMALTTDHLAVATGQDGPVGDLIVQPLPAGVPERIASTACTGMAANGTHVFWTNRVLRRAAFDGHQVELLVQPVQFTLSDPVADVDRVFLADTMQGRILSIPVEGGETNVLAENQFQPASLALNATHVYWVTFHDTEGTIRRVPRIGGEVEDITTGRMYPADLALTATHVYWNENDMPWQGWVMRAPIDGGAPEVLAAAEAPQGLAVDDHYVYWGSHLAIVGELSRMPLAGGSTTVIASNQDQPSVVEVDANHVYWANVRGGTVMRIAKTTIE